MVSSQTRPPPILMTPSLEDTRLDGSHIHRRFFIGPMPERVISQAEKQNNQVKHKAFRLFGIYDRIVSDEDEDNVVTSVLQDYAFQFFLEQGGRESDWGEQQERQTRSEMLRLWTDSEWGRMWKGRKKDANVSRRRWVGGSFEVGDLIGINVLSGGLPKSARSTSDFAASTSQVHLDMPMSTFTADSFATARSHLSPSSEAPEMVTGTPSIHEHSSAEDHWPPEDESVHVPFAASLIRPSPLATQAKPPSKAQTDVLPRPILKDSLIGQTRSDGNITDVHVSSFHNAVGASEGKKKVVHYPDALEQSSASPQEVLAREGTDLPESSAAAAQEQALEPPRPPVPGKAISDDIFMQDRMIVRVSYTRERSLGATFDENQNRSTQHLQYEDWAEFMVVWRKDRIELYEDYTIPLKEWVTGHKHLAFIVPLSTPRTKLSLYSFTDLTFCIACPPTAVQSVSKSRWHFHRAKEGLNIFVFKHRRRSRAVDWTWHLWRRFGGKFPPFIEIRVPLVDLRLKIDIPDLVNDQTNADLTSFTKANLVELCVKALGRIQDWRMLIQRQLEMGAQLELAWRMGTQLDWVWWQEDIEGKEREWAVLAGLALSQAGKAAHLELRRSEHLPSRVHLKDGVRLEEPPSIEGFLERVKPATQVRQPIYLTTHDGLLFSLPPPRAHPPRPPGSVPQPASPDDDFHTTMRNEEVWRGAQQVSEARGVTDLRSIVLVRRALQVVPPLQENVQAEAYGGEELCFAQVDGDEDDDDDVGGEEGLEKSAQDRVHIRMRRCFELVMSTGRIVRFETYSCKTAIEWINRLRALIQYWKARHDADARQEMDIVHFGTGRPRITPRRKVNVDNEQAAPEPASDLSAVLPSLNHLYNWCVLDGCRAITKSGRIFVQKGFRGRYKHVQLFIVAGHLIQYHMKANSVHHRRRGKGINLLDAYIASGVFAAQSLPRGQYNPNTPPMARRYQDGLESADPDEDTLFVVYYHPLNVETGVTERPGKANRVGKDKEAVPKLSTKRKLMVFRTRSRVERDVWCWALNAEIEKVVRTKKEREEKLRHAGGLIRT